MEPEQLAELPTSRVPVVSPGMAVKRAGLREPIKIRGRAKKSSLSIVPPKPDGKRLAVNVAVSIALVCIFVVTLMAVLPVGANGNTLGYTILNGKLSMAAAQSSNTGLIAAQVATATAVTQDGYDGGIGTVAGVHNVILSNSEGDHFSAGQCTYWASWRYHDASGIWVPWLGNAYEWYYGAKAAGWTVSSTPNPNGISIVVLQPGVQGASWGYGHVAIAESINADGSVHTSNWNWQGNWGRTSYWDFRPGPGVSFVWK